MYAIRSYYAQAQAPKAEKSVASAQKPPKKTDVSANQGVSDGQELWKKLLDTLKADAYFAYPHVITSYSIHYTKLYECACDRSSAEGNIEVS